MLILIAGITGMVGQTLARYALEEGYRVRGMSRNPDKLNPDIASKLESFVACPDFLDKAYLANAVKGVDVVIAALPPVPSIIGAGQLALLLEAEKAGVKVNPTSASIVSTLMSYSRFSTPLLGTLIGLSLSLATTRRTMLISLSSALPSSLPA
jgi:uncharacterized protein YbjT (DUF2867 family)